MAQRGELIDNKYEVLMEIGRGGMSVVYLAMDKHLNKQWAIKEITKIANDANNEVVVQSLLVEANLMKKLDHPALPRIVDIIDNADKIYVVMDYIEGESLDKILQRNGAQPQERVIEWAKQLCDALGYLHKQNPPVIYRDMKPANVMLKPEGNLKVIDFGIAREYKQKNLSDTINLGTRGYAAPEQFGGKGQTDARTDIYCLGATLYHLVTGQNPAEEPYEMYPIRTWNPSLSAGLEYIIEKCTKANPDERYQSCDELMYALEHYNEVDDDYRNRSKRKLRAFIGVVAMSVAALAVGITFNLLKTNENNQNYDKKISVSTATSYDEKIQTYKEAIELYPYRTDAYIKILEAYDANGQFGETESMEFMSLYNSAFSGSNKGKYDSDGIEFAELNYKIGTMYLLWYTTSEMEGDSLRVRALKAEPFFANIVSNNVLETEFKDYGIVKSYYALCSFYKNYVVSSNNVKEPTYEEYESLLITLKECINNLDDYDSSDKAYIKLTVYQSLLNLLQGQLKSMASIGIDKADILSIMSTIYDNSEKIRNTITRDATISIYDNIMKNRNSYTKNVDTVYKNVEERN
ncbi:MAG: serine/threonine-protein kinase [Eubacteriales bacterium]|nr:serine/threonine-protein kinase [Eubacteriales bacterium]